jgi:hypothetical protein
MRVRMMEGNGGGRGNNGVTAMAMVTVQSQLTQGVRCQAIKNVPVVTRR